MSTVGAFGINLSTQTGYSALAKIDIYFSAAHNLCGTNDFPPGTPKQVVIAP